jgi:hypothetical protein
VDSSQVYQQQPGSNLAIEISLNNKIRSKLSLINLLDLVCILRIGRAAMTETKQKAVSHFASAFGVRSSVRCLSNALPPFHCTEKKDVWFQGLALQIGKPGSGASAPMDIIWPSQRVVTSWGHLSRGSSCTKRSVVDLANSLSTSGFYHPEW